MNGNEIAARLAAFDAVHTSQLVEGRPLVARLVGRRFEELLESGRWQRPYDSEFGKAMVKTLVHLLGVLGAGFGFCERSEQSLYALCSGGEARRLLSRVAGEAAAKLSLLLGEPVTFDVHLYQFEDLDDAVAYFRWRQAENVRICTDRYCAGVLTSTGAEKPGVPRILEGLGPEEKIELLRQNQIEVGAIPGWQRHGAAVRQNAGRGAEAARLTVDLNLPGDEAWAGYLREVLAT